MNKVLLDRNTVKCFDADGVLIAYEFGERNHNACAERDFERFLKTNNIYENARAPIVMQKFIKEKCDINKVYVITRAASRIEFNMKAKFVHDMYGIDYARIVYVKLCYEKLTVMQTIKDVFPELSERDIIMIDDTVETLTYIQDVSEFSTAHVSTFFD